MLHRLPFHAMGCEMLAVVDSERTPASLAQVPDWFEEWEQVLSRFRYNSELTRLNQIHDKPVRVNPVLWDVFQAARRAEQMTNGLVTPTLLDAILEAGYDRPFDVLPHLAMPRPFPGISAPASLDAITVNEFTRTITLPSGMRLDFGGVAKGWAAYQAMKLLRTDGPALINAGGDIAMSGPRLDGSPWQIGVANPFQKGEEFETLFVNQCGIATSGKDRRRWTQDGILQHHIIDPLTRQPAETDLLTVTVIAKDVLQAEAASKAAFILGSRAGITWIETRPDLAGLFVLDNGQVLYSQKMRDYL